MSSHIKTETEAKASSVCPLARTFADPKATPNCRGSVCAAWRWQPLPSSVLTVPVQKRLSDMKANGIKGDHKGAVAWVMERREELGIPTEPTHGFCGLGGS